MTTVNYAQVIDQSRAELRESLELRERNDKRIAQLVIALRGMARFLPEAERARVEGELRQASRKPVTLKEAISAILQKAQKEGRKLTSNEIREQLEELGVDLADYSQPLGTIFTTLKRLEEKGDVKRETGKDKTITFRWNLPMKPPEPTTV